MQGYPQQRPSRPNSFSYLGLRQPFNNSGTRPDQHDVRVHRTAMMPLHLGVIDRTAGEPDQHRGGRFLHGVGAVVVTAGLRFLLGLRGSGYEEPKGLGVVRVDRRGAGMGRPLELVPLGMNDLQDRRLGQHPGFAVRVSMRVTVCCAESRSMSSQAASRRPGVMATWRGVCQAWAEGTSVVLSALCSMRRLWTRTVPKTVLKVNGVVPRQMIPWSCLPCRWAKTRSASACFQGLPEQAAFEQWTASFDARLEVPGEIGVLLGQGQFQAELGLKDQAFVLDLDGFGGDRRLKVLRGTHGDGLCWRGGVAMRAVLPIPSQLLQIPHRPATGKKFFTLAVYDAS